MSDEMRVGACAYCGGGPLTADHECLQMRLAKEKKMSDEKDVLEEVKDNIKLADRLGYWPFDKNSRDFTREMKRLVREIEKLRSPSHWDKYVRIATPKDYMEQEKKIKTLTKELEYANELGHANVHWKQKEIEKLEAQLAESQEKVKELESKICPGCHGKGFYKSDPAFSQTITKFQCKVCGGKGVR